MPLHRRKRKRYKKYSRILKTKISPHKAMAIKTFGGVPLSTYLQDTMGIPMGSEIEAELHLYEGVPGTMLPQLSQLEHNTPGLGTNVPYAYTQLHPFIPEAASMLIGEPCLGRAVAPRYLSHRRTTAVGQRFYRLVIPGARPVLIAQGGRHAPRRTSSVKLTLDFPANQVRVYLFLSEVTAQHLAVKVRQNAGIGTILPFLGNTIEQGLHAALNEGLQGKLKIIHEALAPDTMYETALNRLPPFMTGMLQKKLKEWLFKALMDYFKQQAQQFVKATEDTADGVTLQFTMANPPGLDLLRQLLKGKASSLGKLSAFEGTPTINVHIKPGYANE